MIETLIVIAQELRSLVSTLHSGRREDVERLAKYFEEIGDTLNETARRISQGEPGGTTCRELAVFHEELEGVLNHHRAFRARSEKEASKRARLRALLLGAHMDWHAPREPDWFDELQDTATNHPRHDPATETVREVERDMRQQASHRLRRRAREAQRVWDAAGEFRALVKTLRARG
jgi:hypothetical protein